MYTPGPWKYEAATKTIRSAPANYWLATMDSFDGAVDHEANARLIAAAPELLEACRHGAMSCHHPACKAHGEYSANPERYCTCHVYKCQAAIAKAEGK